MLFDDALQDRFAVRGVRNTEILGQPDMLAVLLEILHGNRMKGAQFDLF